MPFLTLALGIEVKQAIAAALLSYLPSAGMAVWLFARRGSISWREARLICLAIVPAAWIGARLAGVAPPGMLEALIGLLLLGGGAYALRPQRAAPGDGARLGAGMLLGLGGVTGLGAAMTGAGGAFILIPLLMLLDTPVLAAIGLAQASAVPVAGIASVANIAAGLVDFRLAGGLAAALTAGIVIGTPIAHALPQQKLRRVLGMVVVLAGAAMLVKAGVRLAG